jgi:hypothetical protein
MPFYFQIMMPGRHGYGRFPQRVQEAIRKLPSVRSVSPHQLVLHDWAAHNEAQLVRQRLLDLGMDFDLLRLSQAASGLEMQFDTLMLSDAFRRIDFGPDIAEDDPNLPAYFVHTDAYRRVHEGTEHWLLARRVPERAPSFAP